MPGGFGLMMPSKGQNRAKKTATKAGPKGGPKAPTHATPGPQAQPTVKKSTKIAAVKGPTSPRGMPDPKLMAKMKSSLAGIGKF